jgi:ATP-dependent DNA helicase DinG
MDSVDYLESWARETLTATIQPQDWDWLMLARPEQAEAIRDVRVYLTRSVFQHPANPYECYVVEQEVRDRLAQLWAMITNVTGAAPNLQQDNPPPSLPPCWSRFFANLLTEDSLLWVQVTRQTGQFLLSCGPVDVAEPLRQVWEQQPVVLIGGALDLEPTADIYRQRIGLSDTTTCLKFSADRQHEVIQLYLPDRLPMPNTPQFQPALLHELRQLLTAARSLSGLTVIVVGDVPLKAQVGSVLAAEFGSRVQVEKTCLDDQGILVTGWEFWQQQQAVFPAPNLLVIATLPIPSLEDPLVAGRVAYYKRQRQDWFRLYLLPEALSQLQRAIAPVRDAQGVVALLDNRVNHRSYGQQVLAALSPHARINYVDPGLFSSIDYFPVD